MQIPQPAPAQPVSFSRRNIPSILWYAPKDKQSYVKTLSAGVWWLRSPNANNTNNAGAVNNNGNVNNNNVNNDWAARPASPYRPKYAAGASYLCRLFSVCLHKAKEPYSLSRRGT